MFNADVTDLYSRVNLGAPVYVVNTLPLDGAQATDTKPQKTTGKAAAL